MVSVILPKISIMPKQTITKHSTYSGFKGITYINESDKVVGFAYGYTSTPGQFYRQKLEEQFNKEEKKRWLSDCFEFVELAVDPISRQSGIGKQLHDSLLLQINHKTSLLTTSTDNAPAINLYKAKNWQTIKDNVVVIPSTKPQLIMGKVMKEYS